MGLPNRLDIFDGSNPDGLGHLVAEENRQLARDLTQVPGAQAFDWNRLVAECGQRRWHDPKLWYMARCPLSAEAQPLLARRLCRCIRAVLVAPGKCIVVDLDNTLWGGVLGDDGADGILLGHDYPGSAFRDLQSALLQLHRRGFLLAVASKNDEDIVRRTLDQHPDMLVRTSDFAAILANWDPKPWNLRLIAERLNIGLDSLVFIDDNPVERAEVRSELPMVKVVDLPTEPAGYCSALLELAVLDRPKLLAEDRGRAVLYREDAERREAGRSAESLDQFLADLNMVAVVGRCGPREIDRVHQLIQKTNQFNLTTRRHRFEEIDLLCRTPDAVVAWMRLSDRFGDMGLVCVGILRRLNEQVWEVDTFLMSCRVMGRKAEDAFLAYLFDLVGQGDRRVRGIYRRSEKNQMVSDFYQSHGFVERGGSTDEMVFESERDHRPLWPAHIARKDSIEDK